ncbi:DUF1254 domain-containing protein [Cupriavidus metallidurans]|uniref:DUF1254 domain-containing protein n=1 Tax=Cupriavidus TaxID=106589 RepID=UPI000E911043|nr:MULTISPECIES: DUF1254 domain-containing protein [unclassified Cupriavidus]GMG93135.1 hypothetical protein Cmtc_43550 [Cupriavidus sp. TKC]HBO76915.1 hypothetical protein [Cupriavidus sp.]
MTQQENTAQHRARDAVIHTLPLYEMARMRAATCPRRDHTGRFAGDGPESTLRWVNHVIRPRQLLGPQHRQVVTPNNDTLYTNAWIDLSRGPVVLEVPDFNGRYYVLGLLDFYTNPFGYIGSRTTGTSAGRFLLHGPDWHGTVPAGMQAVACPTNAVWMIGRLLVDGEADLPVVHALQDAIALRQLDGSLAAFAFDVAMQPEEHLGDARRFAEVVNRVVGENPPLGAEAAEIAAFAEVGIGHGIVPTPQQIDLLDAALRGVLADLAKPQPSDMGGGWAMSVDVRESFGSNYLQRALVARNYIGALGVQEAMYVMADRGGDGEPLDGRHAYRLDFAADNLPDVGAFWSLTMYDKGDCMLVPNDISRYSLGDRSPSLTRGADGSLSLYLSAMPPRDEALRGNWLPAPAGPFYVALRLYVPQPSHLNRTYRYPAIQRMEVPA